MDIVSLLFPTMIAIALIVVTPVYFYWLPRRLQLGSSYFIWLLPGLITPSVSLAIVAKSYAGLPAGYSQLITPIWVVAYLLCAAFCIHPILLNRPLRAHQIQ